MNPLDQYPKARQIAYIFQWVVNLNLGIFAVVLSSRGESPIWFVTTTGVFNFVWSYTGLTAAGNVTPKPVTPVKIVGMPNDDTGQPPLFEEG